MNMDNFTSSCQELLNRSVALAVENNNPSLEPIHIFYATLDDEFCYSFMSFFDLPIEQLRRMSEIAIGQLPMSSGGRIVLGQQAQELLDQSSEEAKKLGDRYVGLEHLLMVFADGKFLPNQVAQVLRQHRFTKAEVLERMKEIRKGRTVESKEAEKQYEVLKKYAIDLTELAKKGKLDPVTGRHEEIRRVMQILSRRTKNNPVLIGEPGVGKTAIVEGIAQRIVKDDVPEGLRNKKILSLDLGLLIAGAKHQGEFEERLKNVLKAIEDEQGKIILFIDELHMLVGAGSTGGGMDASNLLKPALARGTLHCIGATTLQEYKKYIEKDSALERRFQKVLIEEPSAEDAISILRGLKERYELHHGIRIKDQAIVNAVLLSSKYIADRYLPDKAIDLVDEAAAMVRMSIDSQPEEIDHLERKIRQLEIEKVALSKEKEEGKNRERLDNLEKELSDLQHKHNTLLTKWKAEKEPLDKINKLREKIENANYEFQVAEQAGDFAKASEIKYGKLVALEKELKTAQEKLKTIGTRLIRQEVDENDVAIVLARWTKIPVDKLRESEKEQLLRMDKILKERVIGQDEAIDEITHAVQMHRAGLVDPDRPIGSFLFLGPTGVGKTEVAKTLAGYLFYDEKKLIRIDMSEYMEKHSVSRLIGSPPGYVGHEAGGQLTEAVRRQPYSVVLFDEIEKGHPEVLNVLLQLLDDGRLTDGQGRTVSFKNCIIIMTSNLGSDIILEAKVFDAKVKGEIDKLLHKVFKPEFLNRIDAIIYFHSLSEKDVERIARIKVDEVVQRLRDRDVMLTVSDSVINALVRTGYVKEFGARPLNREIQHKITIPISKYLLAHEDAKKLAVEFRDNEIKIYEKGTDKPKKPSAKTRAQKRD